MPSLVYIARILNFSEELMDRLKAAGFQVSAFGPGSITADECLLVMTPEAAVAGLNPANSLAESTDATARGSELGGTPPPIADVDVNAHLRSQAAFWNILSTAAGAPSGIGAENKNLGFIPSDAGLRIVARERDSAGAAPGLPTLREVPSPAVDSQDSPLPEPVKPAGTKPPQHIAETSSRRVASPDTRTSPANTIPARKTLRDPFPRLAMAAGLLLILAIALLTNPKSTLSSSRDATALDADHSIQANSISKVSVRAASSLDPAFSTPGGDQSKATGLPRHPGDSDFVAEDFTNHLALRGHSGIAIPNSELKHNAQGRVPRKRIVFN
jgi:hypothetical protein